MFRPHVLPAGRLSPAFEGLKVGAQAGLLKLPCPLLPPPLFCSALSAGWIQRCRADRQAPVSPLTNLQLRDLELWPARALRSHIASLKAAGLLP